ncbi:MAG: glutamate racemase [Muribaculaceae bacterium]|nr:glutamate racemase [Muribaculaceae bacterium]
MSIGIFDSGYGGLTILKEIRKRLPEYDYIYLGDNARAPYGSRSFDIVYDFTLQAVKELFARGCHLVILACNTASAKALRSIQQNDLPAIDPARRVLGVIRPTVEALPSMSKSGHIGLFGTPGTVASHSYDMELTKMNPEMTLTEQACPMWVPLVENNEASSPGADYFVKKYIDMLLEADPSIDTVVLGCTHYPILMPKIREHVPAEINVVAQGNLVAESLADYLRRHPEMECRCEKNASIQYLTTESPEKFDALASLFIGEKVISSRVNLPN